MKKMGITTTVPIEVLLAAGYQPVDLNNVLVADPDPGRLITIAERAGFPLNCCSWIKGIYGVCLDYGIEDVLCVTSGDCSNTDHAHGNPEAQGNERHTLRLPRPA